MKIEILGTGCAKCITLYDRTKEAVSELSGDFEIVKIEEIEKIMEYGVMNTPALVVNSEVKSSGKLLLKEEIKNIINEALSAI